MVGFVLEFLKYFLKNWKWIAVLALVFTVVAFVKSYNNVIEVAQAEKFRADEWYRAAKAWEKRARDEAGIREQEQRQAVSSSSRERNICNQRVDAALRSASKIREIVRVERNENPGICPSNSVITTDQLRDIFAPN